MNARLSAFLSTLRPALSVLVLLTLITGLAYPLAVTGLARLLWPEAAAGSLAPSHRGAGASVLIGQSFSDPGRFWSRPSVTAAVPYNGVASGGSNLGANAPALREAVAARVAALRSADPDNALPVPVDLVTASASGLDPDISLAAAHYQAGRIARVRGMDRRAVDALIDAHARLPWLGFIGEPRVNVVLLNRALDGVR